MKTKITLLLLLTFLYTACAPAPASSSTPQVVDVYATSAAGPWLSELYDCATKLSAALRVVDSPSSAQIYLRIGEPELLAYPAYQIDQEEILIVTHRESPVQNLTLEEARALFAGQGDPSVQVWVYASEEDVQQVFDQLVMSRGSVTSSANLAVNPQQMSDLLNAEKNAVGILPRHWKAGSARDVYAAGTVPVLAIVQEEPQGVIKDLIGCLQE